MEEKKKMPKHSAAGHELKNKRLGIILAGIVFIFGFVLMIGIFISGLIPAGYAVLSFALGVVFALLIFFLTSKGCRVIGILLALVAVVIVFVSLFGIGRTRRTLQGITTTSVRESEVCVYVRNEDKAQYIQDAAGYHFGFVSNIATEDVWQAIAQINADCGSVIATAEYENLVSLADALLSSEIEAVILPSAYLELYYDIDGYDTLPESLRLLEARKVIIQTTSTPRPTETPAPEKQEERVKNDCFIAYISGIDNRGGLIARSLSDVNILAAVNPSTHKVVLISIPRDFYVTMAETGNLDKLTHAGIYGIESLEQTVSDLFDQPIDYYFRVNFGGFIDIIDTLGGISVYSDYSFSVDGYNFYQGYNDLDGEAALDFSRERDSFASGDRQRGLNQLAVIKAVINKLMTMEFLMNFGDVLESVEGSFESDIPYDVLASLVQAQIADWQAWDIETCSVTGWDNNAYCPALGANAYVMSPDMDTVSEACDRILEVLEGE